MPLAPPSSPAVIGALVTDDYMYELAGPIDGLVMGHGTPYQVIETTGLEDLPEVKVSDSVPPSVHGGFGGNDFSGVRKITFKIVIDGTVSDGTPSVNVQYLIEQLARLLRPSETPLTLSWKRPYYPVSRHCVVKPRKRDFVFDSGPALGWTQGAIELWAYDPRAYSVFQKSSSLILNIGYTTTQLSLINSGSVGTGPTITVNGPSTNPRFTNADDENRTMKFNVALAGGDQMIVDSINKTVTINGDDRYDVVAPDNQWWELQPGANRVVYNRSNSSAVSSSLVQWRDAYL